jgi:outer membrane biosynthesis protein TonB
MTNDKKNKIKGIIGAILFHILLLIVLLFMALRTPLPLPGEEGVLVNLGFDDFGMENVQMPEPAPAEAVQTPPPQEQELVEEEYVAQDIEEAPAISEKKPEPKKKEPEKVKPTPVAQPVQEPVKEPEPIPEQKPKPDPKAMYKGNSTTSTDGGQEGITGQAGDQGKPNGTEGSPVYTGAGDGTGSGIGTGTGTGPGDGDGSGISFSLGGRGSLSLHKPSYDSREQGKVVVTIKVNREGYVTSAVAGAKGTNVSDQNLWQLAKDAALRSRFKSDPDAPEIQTGTITYNFIRQN